jgi:hypothetical protein
MNSNMSYMGIKAPLECLVLAWLQIDADNNRSTTVVRALEKPVWHNNLPLFR